MYDRESACRAVRLLISHETACNRPEHVSPGCGNACRGHWSAQRGCENTPRVRVRAHRGSASANKQCPGAGQAPVEETRPGEAQDYVV